jgi:hypothetical protein
MRKSEKQQDIDFALRMTSAMMRGLPLKAGDTFRYWIEAGAVSLYRGDSEAHSAPVTLSDGSTYSVELEMTLEHR